ncbi:MAG TPA: Maf family protein [Bacteroidales bacterium]|nr:Maf family protein [Bacteroidales bacterium]HOR82309.1 Maf family protein [Bacteroidales bacterium]HPJ91914.1 Maf family protein [Bacteroidales bacterium]
MLLKDLADYKIVLASLSPRRQELLSQLGIVFSVCDSHTNETNPKGLSVYETVQYLAQQKAEIVFKSYKKQQNVIVIAGDTIVSIDGEIMGKPKDRKDACRMLRKLSGKKHLVLSGVSVVAYKKTLTRYDEAWVTFDDLTDEEIVYYVDKYMPYDKAGAYGIQEWIGCRAVSKIEGSFFTIMGFPTHLIWKMLEEIIKKK